MDATNSFQRNSINVRNGQVGKNGYKVILSSQAKSFIASKEGFHRVAIEKSIQRLSSVPRPKDLGKLIIKTPFTYRLETECCDMDFVIHSGTVKVLTVAAKQQIKHPKGKIGNDIDSILPQARSAARAWRVHWNGPNLRVGVSIVRDNSGRLAIDLVGDRVAEDGVGFNKNNIGARKAGENTVAFYISERATHYDYQRQGPDYAKLASDYNVPVIVETIATAFSDVATVYFPSKPPMTFSGGMSQ